MKYHLLHFLNDIYPKWGIKLMQKEISPPRSFPHYYPHTISGVIYTLDAQITPPFAHQYCILHGDFIYMLMQ